MRLVAGGCLSLPDILQYDWDPNHKGAYQLCRDQTKIYYKMIKENHYDFVILAQAWSIYLRKELINKRDETTNLRSLKQAKISISNALDKALEQFIASGAQPIIIKAIAWPEVNLNDCFFNQIRRRLNPEQCDFRPLPRQEEWFDKLFEKMQKKYSQLILIAPKRVQCSKELCKSTLNGLPLFRDQTHLTDYASYFLAKAYLREDKNPFLS